MCWSARGAGPTPRAVVPPAPRPAQGSARPPLDHDEGEVDKGRGLWTNSHPHHTTSSGAVPAPPAALRVTTPSAPCPQVYSSAPSTPCPPGPPPGPRWALPAAAVAAAATTAGRPCGGWWSGSLRWPLSLHVLLLTLCYSRHVAADDQLNLIHARLVNMLKTKHSLLYRRQLRADAGLDLREHRVFHSDPKLDCCPTLTEFEPRRTGINPSGMVLELFSSANFTQSFYETICHPSLRNRPCQFIDPRISYATRCVQQFSYVYAIGRTYGSDETFRVDYIRIPSGCKCQVKQSLLKRRKKKSAPGGLQGLDGLRGVPGGLRGVPGGLRGARVVVQ